MSDSEKLTIGIEEEYQIIDPESRELTSFIREFLDQSAILFRDQLQPELLQSQVEVGSKVCKNIQDVSAEVRRLRSMVCELAHETTAPSSQQVPIHFPVGKISS